MMLKGRQALWIVYQHYRINADAGALYDLSDLMCVKLRGDALEAFMFNWDHVLIGMAQEPPEKTLCIFFLENLRGCHIMREEVNHYDRARQGDAHRTYEFLQDSVRRYLERKRHGENRKAVAGALANTAGGGKPALAAPDGAKKKKTKGAGKGTGTKS